MNAFPRTFDDIREITVGDGFLIALLFYLHIIRQLDRFGIAGILITIQEHYDIADDKAGLLYTVLIVTHACSALVFGYYGDRYSRKTILLFCVILWTCASAGFAYSIDYTMLLCCRALLGIGQGGFTVVSPCIISDVALRGARTIMLSIYYFGIPIGSGLGYVLVSNISQLAPDWRYGLCVGPALSILGIVFLYFIRVPERGKKETVELGRKLMDKTSYGKDLIYLAKVPSFVLLTCAYVSILFVVGAIAWWLPTTLYYGFKLIPGNTDVRIQTVSLVFGVVTSVTGLSGGITGVLLSRILRVRFPNCDPLICGVTQCLAMPLFLASLYFITIHERNTFAFIFFAVLSLSTNWALEADIILYVVIPTRRTGAHGVHIFITHIFGECIGPYIVGSMSEYFKNNLEFTKPHFFLPFYVRKPEDTESVAQQFFSLQMSLFIITFVNLLGIVSLFLSSQFVIRDAENEQEAIVFGEAS